jgi:hypothetical protein
MFGAHRTDDTRVPATGGVRCADGRSQESARAEAGKAGPIGGVASLVTAPVSGACSGCGTGFRPAQYAGEGVVHRRQLLPFGPQ